MLILCLFLETVCGFLLWCVGDFVLQLCLFTHKKKEGGGKGGGGNGKTSVLLHVNKHLRSLRLFNEGAVLLLLLCLLK